MVEDVNPDEEVQGLVRDLNVDEKLIGKYFPKVFELPRPGKEPALEPYGKITERIGSGGFADVYRLELHPFNPLAAELGHHVALKIVNSKSIIGSTEVKGRLISRFQREAKIGRFLMEGNGHPCLLKYGECEMVEIDGDRYMYLISEYVPGTQQLSEYIEEDITKRLTIEDALSVTGRIADALQYMHERGVSHRDVKPENILFNWLYNSDSDKIVGHREKLIDLGISKQEGDSMTQLSVEGEIKGTPAYISPEVADGKAGYDKESDVWGLSSTLYALLAGNPPYGGITDDNNSLVALLDRVRDLSEPVPPLKKAREDIPWEIHDLCHFGLIKDHKKRINMPELNREIRTVAKKLGIEI